MICSRQRCKRRVSVKLDDLEGYCKTHAVWIADKLVGDSVKQRDRVCQNCGTDQDLEWAHIHSRGMRAIRWEPDNSMALCRACHYRFTRAPAAWTVFVEDTRPGLWTRLLHKQIAAERDGKHVDMAEIIRRYREEVTPLHDRP